MSDVTSSVSPRMLLTHEWLAAAGGSENVFEQMGLAFPSAVQYCLWNDDPTRFPRVHETWLRRTPLRRNKALALPFLRAAQRSIPVDAFDVVFSSSHVFGHYTATRAARRGVRAFVYAHSPARYIWSPEIDARGRSLPVRTVAPPLRWLDRRSASSTVHYAANSEFVRRRIADSWRVDAEVIHPPVSIHEIQDSLSLSLSDADQKTLDSLPDSFILGASRLIDYKRLDLVLRLGESLGKAVVIAGDGPLLEELSIAAGEASVRVLLLGRVSDRLLHELYRQTELFVFLAIEDFGIMPVEAVAAGAPVLVNVSGGASEGVRNSEAAVACDPNDWPATVAAAKDAMSLKGAARPDAVDDLSNEAFRSTIQEWTGCR